MDAYFPCFSNQKSRTMVQLFCSLWIFQTEKLERLCLQHFDLFLLVSVFLFQFVILLFQDAHLLRQFCNAGEDILVRFRYSLLLSACADAEGHAQVARGFPFTLESGGNAEGEEHVLIEVVEAAHSERGAAVIGAERRRELVLGIGRIIIDRMESGESRRNRADAVDFTAELIHAAAEGIDGVPVLENVHRVLVDASFNGRCAIGQFKLAVFTGYQCLLLRNGFRILVNAGFYCGTSIGQFELTVLTGYQCLLLRNGFRILVDAVRQRSAAIGQGYLAIYQTHSSAQICDITRSSNFFAIELKAAIDIEIARSNIPCFINGKLAVASRNAIFSGHFAIFKTNAIDLISGVALSVFVPLHSILIKGGNLTLNFIQLASIDCISRICRYFAICQTSDLICHDLTAINERIVCITLLRTTSSKLDPFKTNLNITSTSSQYSFIIG